MRKTGWALIGVTALMAGGLQVADAAITCKIIHSWCPAPERRIDRDHGRDRAGDNDRAGDKDTAPTAVPEPVTLMLLGAGVSAVGAAALRRRNKSKNPQ